MKFRSMLVVVSMGLTPVVHAAEEKKHWDYRGTHGPAAWAGIDPEFSGCKLGRDQSPIDIRGATKAALPALATAYQGSAAEVVNTGHTVQVNLTDAGALTLDGVSYKLVQFHFHTPSEERVKGRAYAMVAHLVHKSAEGKLAVVAVLLKQGRANATLAPVFADLPAAEGAKRALPGTFNASDLLPEQRGYYRFVGSLTTPPCSEGVRWQVLKQPVEVSKAQLNAFRKLYRMNARPVQPLNGRVVEEV